MSNGRIFLLDNQDSFAYNLVDELAQLGFTLEVYRNQLDAEYIFSRMKKAAQLEPVMLCLSPGPGHPAAAGCLIQLLKMSRGQFPVLGICLGFQALIHQAGGEVGRAKSVMHGKTSSMSISSHAIFENISNPMQIARYHSLQASVTPDCIDILAAVDEIPMVAYDHANACLGFQFHPESIMCTQGSLLLKNTVAYLLAQAENLKCSL